MTAYIKSPITLILILLLSGVMTQCTKEKDRTPCSCSQNYDSTITYVTNDMVSYNGTCWYAVAQGRGITPGPWMMNGNDIWKECSDFIPAN